NPKLPALLTKHRDLALDVLRTVTGALEGRNSTLEDDHGYLKQELEKSEEARIKELRSQTRMIRDGSRTSK
ncbi:MAG: hypothetical protein Q9183_006454, partial [Haloplaca sp. 2 TL-2023]